MAFKSELDPSPLGTKQYWDSLYQREKQTNNENAEDEGEVWFDDSGAEDKIIEFVETNIPPNGESFPRILDLGSGNGHLLFSLADESYRPNLLTGIDYSDTAIEFSRQIARNRQASNPSIPYADISFYTVDLLSNSAENKRLLGQYDLIIDKGTLDAIALSDNGAHNVNLYPQCVAPLVNSSTGLFLITSCNFTQKELIALFSNFFSVYQIIDYPTFQFGGVKGQTVSSIVFKRVNT